MFLLQEIKVDIEIGNVTTKANATAIVTTNRQNLSTGTVTVTAAASTLVTGEAFEIGTSSVKLKNGMVLYQVQVKLGYQSKQVEVHNVFWRKCFC